MTLLSMCQDICDEIGFPRPTSIAANTSDPLARQLFALAKRAVLDVSQAKPWPMLERAYTFALTVGVAHHALPADFANLIGDTGYDATSYYTVRASVNAQEWRRRKLQLTNPLQRYALRLFAPDGVMNINIDPVPQGTDTIAFEYATSYYVVDAAGAAKATFTSDDDTTSVQEALVKSNLTWRIRRAKGLDYSSEFVDYMSSLAQEYAKAIALPEIDPGGETWVCPLTEGYVPDAGFGAS